MTTQIANLAMVSILLIGCSSSPRPPRLTDMQGNEVGNGAGASVANQNSIDGVDITTSEGRLSLLELLRQGRTRSPKLGAARESAIGWRHRRAQVTALPDPALRMGWYAESIETRTGSQEFMVGITQKIPWPEKLAVAGKIADFGAAQAQVRQWIVARDVLVGLTKNFHELSYLLQADRAAAELEALWSDLIGRAAGSEKISGAEIARAEVRLAQVHYDRDAFQELAEIERERIRGALFLPSSFTIPEPQLVGLPELRVQLEELRQATLSSNQEVLLATIAIQEARARVELAELAKLPDFSVGGRYIFTDPRNDASPTGNGNDPIIVEFGMTLPIQRGAKNAKIAEARHRMTASAFRRDALVQELRANLAEAYFRALNEFRLMSLHEKTLLPQAERAALEAEAILEKGASGLAGLIETIAARHQVRLGALRARADYAIRLSRIEKIIGTPLQRVTSLNKEKTP